MDILELIKQNRQTIKELFLKIETAQETEKLYEYFNKIYEELITYSQAEESTLYTSMSKYQGNEELIEVAKAEHQESKKLLEEMEFFSPTSSEFKHKFQQLKQVVYQHWEKEEKFIFMQSQKLVSQQEKEQLGNKFVDLKNKLQQELMMN
ncbi:hemerythrin domain-containing protein [Aliterella atlantica]|uniref:Hemerythrin-like domain-containing protein n=1 Tax=Aliterella atlantica CENA595 TaxID=1618023 RepID=A0A0D8ZTZ4_9CYAN|nr:hemerythrin domain-containing protein [Aliterella atlantica]KJH70706.1 hypothetical protein UH38_16795 [Aliterella atlantica CENA595]